MRRTMDSNKSNIFKIHDLDLTPRITDLETEMLQKEAAHDEEVSNITQKYYRHAESDKMIIEKYTITVQNLEKLNEDLSSQFENLKKVHTREKELNKQLQKQTQENLLSNKEVLDMTFVWAKFLESRAFEGEDSNLFRADSNAHRRKNEIRDIELEQ